MSREILYLRVRTEGEHVVLESPSVGLFTEAAAAGIALVAEAKAGVLTTLGRAYERATGQTPFRIPDSWMQARSRLDMSTPFNLSSNNDIVGGNSGSAMLNARGEVVGLMFDGNIHSISGSYWFDTAKNRSIAVHPAIMREALEKVYKADDLLGELAGK